MIYSKTCRTYWSGWWCNWWTKALIVVSSFKWIFIQRHKVVEQLEDTSHRSEVLDGKWVHLHIMKIHVMQGLNQMFTFNLSLLPIAMMMKNGYQNLCNRFMRLWSNYWMHLSSSTFIRCGNLPQWVLVQMTLLLQKCLDTITNTFYIISRIMFYMQLMSIILLLMS